MSNKAVTQKAILWDFVPKTSDLFFASRINRVHDSRDMNKEDL
jgi:hypothetical protein